MPPGSPPLLTLTTLAFPLITLTPRIMRVFYLILFQAGFSDMQPGHNTAWESNILFGTPVTTRVQQFTKCC